ncbi:MAG: glutathione synthase, partial [Xanthomonadales bacterium]|nr:glutathione synthase [Xanthomonadales bacterium]
MTEAQNAGGTSVKTGVVMDPISGITTYKDSTFAMLLEAQRRGHEIWYMEPGDLTIRDGIALGHMRPLSVRDNRSDWFTLGESENRELASLDMILMRKDPPFNMDYV